MTTEEGEELNRLCLAIQNENDHKKFSELLLQLHQLLEKKEHRFRDDRTPTPCSDKKAAEPGGPAAFQQARVVTSDLRFYPFPRAGTQGHRPCIPVAGASTRR